MKQQLPLSARLDDINNNSITHLNTHFYSLSSSRITRLLSQIINNHAPGFNDIHNQYNPSQLEQKVYIFNSINKQFSQYKDFKLIKSQQEVNQFYKQYFNLNNPQNNQSQQLKINKINQIILNYNYNKQYQSNRLINKFLENRNHSKWTLNILAQLQVQQFVLSQWNRFIHKTIMACCKPNNNKLITITTQNIIITQQPKLHHFSHQPQTVSTIEQGIVEQAIPFTSVLQVNFQPFKYQNKQSKYQYKGQPHISDNVIRIQSGKTLIYIKFKNTFDFFKFYYTWNLIRQISPYFKPRIHKSFSPVRSDNKAKFYCQSIHYFSDLSKAIQNANNKICITGWCITPYLLLQRPQNLQNGPSRLDKLIERAAKRGVKIFILIFKEPNLATKYNDSAQVCEYFNSFNNPNIKIMRHGSPIPYFWSHHEKSVIIDQQIAFMGGLDICYGRWDTAQHPIWNENNYWQGTDYCNDRTVQINQPSIFRKQIIKQSQPRMGWVDIAMQFQGPAVTDLQRHFVQYWYFVRRDLSDEGTQHLKNTINRFKQLKRNYKLEKLNKNIFNQLVQNNIVKQFFSKQQKYKQKVNKQKNSEHQKHRVIRQSLRQVQYGCLDRLKHMKQSFTDVLHEKTAISSKQIIVQGKSSYTKPGNLKLQLCRSSSKWSMGLQKKQSSIYQAYRTLLNFAQHFIYIQNQFFMSDENQISEIIADRIRRAHFKKQNFKVIVMMPLLPGFKGEVTDKQCPVALRAQMVKQWNAINRQQNSIYQLLSGSEINYQDYITFVSLRNHYKFDDGPKTQIIYIHSKLMIIDDKYMIIGSANINDRSLLGDRDSQLAMVIQDPNGKLGYGQIFQFRSRIWKNHFGLLRQQCVTISQKCVTISQKCVTINKSWGIINARANANTQIYRDVFGCYPDDTAKTIEETILLKKQKQISVQRYEISILKLKSKCVRWPMNFLQNCNIDIRNDELMRILPDALFA